MRRKKRFAIGWIALGLAVVAMVPVTAEAKPLPTDTSHEHGMPVYVIGTLSPDDRDAEPGRPRVLASIRPGRSRSRT